MSTPTSMATLDELSVAEMDAQIALYESMTLSLKMRRNQRTAIAKLPQEILLLIFGKAIEDAGDQRLASFTVLRRITHVCKAWQHVAIHAPVLWARIPIYRRNHEWTQLALSRSKKVPLDVSVEHFSSRYAFAPNMVLKELPRIASLSLKCTSYELERARRVIADFPSAPHLTSLHMQRIHMSSEASTWNTDISGAVFPNSYKIPLEFLENAPQLRKVSLDNVNFDFDAPLFSNLTTLSISSPSAASFPSWIPLQNALGRMPLLNSLKLHLDQVVPGVALSNDRPVALSHLQCLSLHMKTPTEVQAALSLITVPPIKTLSLEWLKNPDDTAIAIQSSLFVRAAELIDAKNSGASFTKLEFIARRSSTKLHFRASAPDIDAGPFLELIYPAKPKTLDNLSDVTKLVTKTFPLSSITHLAFETFWDNHHTADDRTFLYADLLEALPHIQTLSMRGSNAHNFLDILWFIYRDGKLVSGSILKELRTITWKRVDLRHWKSWVTECFLSDLYDREQDGIPPLQELILEDAKNVTPDLLECLQEDIPSVICRATGKYPDLEPICSDWEVLYDSEDWDADE